MELPMKRRRDMNLKAIWFLLPRILNGTSRQSSIRRDARLNRELVIRDHQSREIIAKK